jgi:ABC-type transport system involved in multi-copper enzyme maturation permease subunit
MNTWIMAGMTFREAARKRLLWTALAAGAGFLLLFAIGLRLQIADFAASTPAFVRYQILSGMLMIGLYTVDLLAVVMTILTSVDTISGEISTGTIHAIAIKPMSRWQILFGKWLGFAGMLFIYVAMMFGGTIAVSYVIAGLAPQNPMRGFILIFLECVIALSVTFMCGTWLSSLATGVVVLGLQGLSFMGGWLEQMSGFTDGSRLAIAGIVTSLVMPTEAVWRRAAYEMESPLAGSLPQFAIFSDVSIPSPAMIAYASMYLLAVLSIAIYHFQQRDL